MTTMYPYLKSYTLLKSTKKPIRLWAITFEVRVHCGHFSSDSVRAYVFQQFSCRTYALTPSGSKVMVHGVFDPQYQGYGKKLL
jgi:hypothetical protein